MSIEAMKQMVEALEAYQHNGSVQLFDEAITTGRQAIEQAEKQEPVAMQTDVIVVNLVREGINKHRARELAEHFIKHTRPQPKREWVGLTDEAIWSEYQTLWPFHPAEEPRLAKDIAKFGHAIEALSKEKNT